MKTTAKIKDPRWGHQKGRALLVRLKRPVYRERGATAPSYSTTQSFPQKKNNRSSATRDERMSQEKKTAITAPERKRWDQESVTPPPAKVLPKGTKDVLIEQRQTQSEEEAVLTMDDQRKSSDVARKDGKKKQ